MSLTPAGLGRASLTYALGGIAYKGVALLAMPVLARLLMPAELGLLDLAAIVATLIGVVVSFGTDQSIAYWEQRSEAPANIWGAALALIGTGVVAGIALVLILRAPLAQWLTGSADAETAIAAAGVYGAVMAISALTLLTVRLRGVPRTYAVASFLIIGAEMSAALAVAWLVDDPVPWMVVAWSVGAAAVAIPFLVRHLPRVERPELTSIRRLARYGAPLIPITMAWLVGDLWIRGMLGRSSELALLGEYGIAYRIASGLGLLVTGLGVAWYPYLYRSSGDALGKALSLMPPAILTLTGLAVVIVLLAPEIIAIVAGDAYSGARTVVAPLSAAMVTLGVFVLIAGMIGSRGTTALIGLAAIVGMLVQMAAATWLIPSGGLTAAGIASLLGYLAATFVGVVVVRNHLFGTAGLPVIAAITLAAFSLAITSGLMEEPLALRAAVAAVVVLATGGVLIRSSRVAVIRA